MPPSSSNKPSWARRAVLLAGVGLPVAAWAETATKPKHPAAKPGGAAPAAKPATPKKAEPVYTGTPAKTPIGPLDTEGFNALIADLRAGRLGDSVPAHGTLNRVERTVGLPARAARSRAAAGQEQAAATGAAVAE